MVLKPTLLLVLSLSVLALAQDCDKDPEACSPSDNHFHRNIRDGFCLGGGKLNSLFLSVLHLAPSDLRAYPIYLRFMVAVEERKKKKKVISPLSYIRLLIHRCNVLFVGSCMLCVLFVQPRVSGRSVLPEQKASQMLPAFSLRVTH